MHLEPWQWALLALGAFLVGVSKTGVAGLGILAVAIFALLNPARQATGFLLPLLIVGDVIAVVSYRRHAVWGHLWRLFPWTVLGVGFGTLALGRLDNATVGRLIGGIVVAMSLLHLWRKRSPGAGASPDAWAARAPGWFAPAAGIVAGFTTQVANAAGPVMILYLLAMGLPKMEFMGTGAVFFLCLNLFKVPFMAWLGLINPASLQADAWLAPAVVAGALAGRWILHRINQQGFEWAALALTLAAGLKLLW